MNMITNIESQNVHQWLKRMSVVYFPGFTSSLIEEFAEGLMGAFRKLGNQTPDHPENFVDVLLTTAPFGSSMDWREAALFTARKRFKLKKAPTVVTIIHATPAQFDSIMEKFEHALSQNKPDPADYDFGGLASQAYLTLHDQGRRGGPILALERLLQAQSKSIRIILVIGDVHPEFAYTFDLVGAYPRSDASDPGVFYSDLALRVMTAVSTREVTNHQVLDEKIPLSIWRDLKTPQKMIDAGLQLGKRNFFSEMININDLVNIPAIPESVASQYSEGCFASWDPILSALITTVTGSAKPINKYNLSDDDLAVIVGVRDDYQGAIIQQIADKSNAPPSSEAVELIQMDRGLPKIMLGEEWVPYYGYLDSTQAQVPVARSKLHGHRGVASFDPRYVEEVSLESPYYHYPVSCASEAQANAIFSAFSRSVALNTPSDPRQLIFTVLPGHGIVIVEKWVSGKVPFQVMWEYMDEGKLNVVSPIPQGLFSFEESQENKYILTEP